MKWSKLNCKQELFSLTKQFIKFGFVGLSNTAISLSIYYVFLYINPGLYIFGNTIGFIVSVLNSYYWNNKYVFKKSEQEHLKTLLKTYMAYGGTFILGTVLLFLMVEVLGVSQYLAPIVNLVITIPLNFLINKFWAFK